MGTKKVDIANIDITGVSVGANAIYVAANARFEWILGTYTPVSTSADWTGTVTETIIRDSSGEANDKFGYSVATKGDNIVVGVQGDNYYGGAFVYTLSGGSWSQSSKLEHSDTGSGDLFGWDVDISSDGLYVVAGHPYDEEETSGFNYTNLNYGAAYIFYYNGSSWSQQAKLKPSDRSTGDQFGRSVAMNNAGDYIIGGAPYQESGGTQQGAAYIFTRSGTSWSQQAKLEASDGQNYDLFGEAVDISSTDADYAIVGAYLEDGAGSGDARRGKAYVFTRSGTSWSQQAILTPSDAADNQYFGFAVTISDDGAYACVGAYGDATEGANTGAAYIFARSGTSWSQQAKLTASDAATSDLFGRSMRMNSDGTFVIIGAYGDDGPSDDAATSGTAYIFKREDTTWSQVKQLRASDYQASDVFGGQICHAVGINASGNRVVVGAPQEDGGAGDPTSNQGAVYIYDV